MVLSLLVAISLLGSGIQAGALLMFGCGVCPTYRTLDVSEWSRIHVSLDRSIERYMPALNIVTGTATLVLLFFAQPADVRLLRILALACNIGLALMSELVNVRINKRVAARVAVGSGGAVLVDDEAERDQLAATRDRWIRWHGWRTADITTGFLLSVIAVLLTVG